MQRVIAAILGALGVGSLTPAGREFAKAIFWDRVLAMVNPYLAVPLGYILDYAPAAVFGVFAAALVAPERVRASAGWVRTRVNWYLLSAGVLGASCLLAVALYFWDQSRGPIVWQTSTSSPIQFFIHNSGKQPVSILGLSMVGRSRVDFPIRVSDAYFRSLETGETVQLLVVGTPGTEVHPSKITIEPFGRVDFAASLRQDELTSSALSVEEFRRRFSRFVFVFKYGDGRTLEIPFTRESVNNLISDAQALHTANSRRQPGVIVHD